MTNPRGLPLADAVRFGWRTLRGRFGFVVGTTVVAWLVPAVIRWGGHAAFDGDAQDFAMTIIVVFVSATLYLGLARIHLRFRDGELPIFEDLFDGLGRIHHYVGATIIMGIAIVMGLILLVVPGIVMLIRLWFVPFVLADDRAGALDAIQKSWDITRGHTFDLFLLFLLLVGVNLLGLICLGVGVLISAPVSGLALAYIYRHLKPRALVAPSIPAAPAPA